MSSTEQLHRLGDKKWGAILNRFYSVARESIGGFSGQEVATQGDAFFATFEGPARAIRCAGVIRDRSSRELDLEIRSGVHVGECERMGDNIGGITVHAAARVCSQAQSGEILVSSTVKDLAAGSGIEFEDRGLRTLKGLPEAVWLFAATRL